MGFPVVIGKILCVGKPALHSFNGKGGEENFVTPASSSINSFGECDTTQVQRCPEYHTPQDSLTFNEAAVFNEDDIHTSNRRLETEVKIMFKDMIIFCWF